MLEGSSEWRSSVEMRGINNMSSNLMRRETGDRFIVFSRGPWDDSGYV